ncbi:MAG: peptidylprolyl isomerase [bacterium]|nr:peptidylprolyl isomerase [bacterium]
MHKNIFINMVGALVLLAVLGSGFYLYDKTSIPDPSEKVSVNSTGGSLSVTQIPIQPVSVVEESETQPIINQKKPMNKVTIDTNFGKVVLELYEKDAPKTVENFKTLAGKGFYNNLIFHRVIPGFMIQGGDPQGTGMGGPGFKFADELDPNTPSAKAGYQKGVLAMANSGPNTNGSQFFIMLENYPLPLNYTIFGHVVSGQEVVDAIGKTKTGPNDRPITPVVMKSVTVSE